MDPKTPLPERLREALVALRPDRPDSVDALRALYAENVEFRDPLQALRGVDAFLAMNRRLLGRARELSFEVTSATGDDSEAFLVWTAHFLPKIGPRMVIEGVTHAKARNGRVVYHRDYWDLGESIASVIPGGPAALRVLLKPFA